MVEGQIQSRPETSVSSSTRRAITYQRSQPIEPVHGDETAEPADTSDACPRSSSLPVKHAYSIADPSTHARD